jgi:hypothetical protein
LKRGVRGVSEGRLGPDSLPSTAATLADPAFVSAVTAY